MSSAEAQPSASDHFRTVGPALSPLSERGMDRLLGVTRPQPGETVVDLGADAGLLTLELARRGLYVWTLDSCPSTSARLRSIAATRYAGDVHVIQGAADALPLPGDCADLVVAGFGLPGLSHRARRRALAEARRVLRPRGRLVLRDAMYRLSPAPFVKAFRKPGGPSRPASARWWCGAAMGAGFVDVRVEALDHDCGLLSAHTP